jgi:PKD repeat protein
LAIDSEGGIFVSEMGNHRVNVLKSYIFYLDDGFDLDMIGKDITYLGPIGPITITEQIINEEWLLTSIDCTTTNPDIEPVVSGTSVFVNLERDDEVHCIFNNLLPDPVAADFEGTPTSGPAPLLVDFTNQSVGDFDTCLWDFGDEETSDTCDNQNHTFTNPGVYTTTLTASGWGGEDTEIKPEYITVYTPVNADFSTTPTSGIAPLAVDFTNLSTGDYDTCSWTFGDGGTSDTCEDPSYTFNTPGVFTATLTASGLGGEDTETKTEYITVYDPVNADFSGTPTNGGAPLTVDFTNLSTGDFDTCSWTFGDGGTSDNCEDPSHEFTDLGIYTVTLEVSGLGGADTETKTEYIGVYVAVNADFSGTPTSGIGSQVVDFTNLSTGNYDTCNWTFGDGETSSDCSDQSHTYNNPGAYTVELIVSGLGGEDTETKTNYIVIYTPSGADFSGSPTSGGAPLTVNFTSLSSGDYDTCSWIFGDGGTSDSCGNPSHTYTEIDLYTVSLTVSGFGGEETETKSDYIAVYTPVNADFSGTPTSGIAPFAVDFTDLSSGEYDTCSWDFGDGGTSDSCEDPSYSYTTSSVYTVTLTASGLGGEDTETKTDYITVYEPVNADFSGTPTSGIARFEVDFTDLSTGDYDTCSWTFGDGGTSTSCEDPRYTFSVPGVYTVSLTISGLGGNDAETKVDYITVYTAVDANFTASPTSGFDPLTVDFTNLSSGDYSTCLWIFGDGETSDSCDDPTHIYVNPGVYTVSLTVSGFGGDDTKSMSDYITVEKLNRIYLPLIHR